jgi:hypothetical protein
MADIHQAWDWAQLQHSPAATYRDGQWWPVLESGISGTRPVVLRRCSFSSHGAALATARDVVRRMIEGATVVMDHNQPEMLEKPEK